MQIGPFRFQSPIRLQERSRRDFAGEDVLSGLPAVSGFLESEEYNPDVQGQLWFTTVDKMRNHSRLLGAESIITLPALMTPWQVEPAKDAGSSGQEAAALLNEDLFSGTMSFTDLLRLAILSRCYGVRVLAPRWQVNGRVVLTGYQDTKPATYWKWFFEGGKPKTLVQQGIDPDTGQTREVEVDLARCWRFTWKEEYGNPLGKPDYRPLYPDWFRLEYIHSVLMVAVERAGIGAYIGKIPRDLWEIKDFRNEVKRVLQQLRSTSRGAVTVPEDVSIEALQTLEKQGLEGLVALLDMYETNMVVALLENILSVGMRDVGTQALAEVLLEMFLMSEDAMANWFTDQFELQAIQPWLDWNYPGLPMKERPQLTYSSMRLTLRRETLLEAINETTKAGNLPAGQVEIEEFIRNIMSLPRKPEPTSPAITEKPAPSPEPSQEEAPRSRLSLSTGLLPDDRGAEPAVDLLFTQAEATFQRQVQFLLEPVRDGFLRDLRELSRQYDAASASEQAKLLREIGRWKIDREGLQAYQGALREWLQGVYEAAAQVFAVESAPAWVGAWVESQATALAHRHFDELLFTAQSVALRELTAGRAAQALSAAKVALQERMQANLEEWNRFGSAFVEKLQGEGVLRGDHE